VGDTRQAQEWFERVPGEISDSEHQAWILDAARQQQLHPREWFG
jgi:hypothetical protein